MALENSLSIRRRGDNVNRSTLLGELDRTGAEAEVTG
jgi:hypothetical protein